jgi:hypothetical protein
VFLSMPEPRRLAYRYLDHWLDDYLKAYQDNRNNTDTSAPSSGKG